MNSYITQLVILISQFSVNLFVGLSPIAVITAIYQGEFDISILQRSGVVALFLHFGAGVFLSTCLIILIPESRQHLGEESLKCSEAVLSSDTTKESFPLPELTVLCGFFLTFILEELSHYGLFHLLEKKNGSGRAERVRFCSCAKRHTECSRTFKAEEPDQNLFSLDRKQSVIPGDVPILNRQIEQVAATMKTNLLQSSIISQPNYGTVPDITDTPAPLPVTIPAPVIVTNNNGGVTIIRRHQPTCRHTEITSSILLLVLVSILTFLQGIGIGRAIHASAWTLVLILNLQQVLVMFVQGSVSAMTRHRWSSVMTSVVIPCLMSALASCLVVYEEDWFGIQRSACGLVTAIVCGGLLYLTFCDILRRDEVKSKTGFKTFLCFVLGSVGVASVRYLEL